MYGEERRKTWYEDGVFVGNKNIRHILRGERKGRRKGWAVTFLLV